MTDRTMILGLHLGSGYGSQSLSWRAEGVDPASYTNLDAQVRCAQKAERGKFAFLFLPDSLAMTRGIAREVPQATSSRRSSSQAVAEYR
ncbi:hypothetical protein [Nocardia asteroides]|uniref:hypothetical protein n=1 Tax=Nocardia asteroides TaxID=1824 RepID=UPI001E3BFC09|nr:hypothetical protein [Nocardia asteroides]UGT62694.1 hypothetical protein LTT61_04950 [Nocardia asteroides]